jgi:trk system potassium uptake protein
VLRPVRLLPSAFLLAIVVGSVLLMLPVSRADHEAALVMPALFTSVSAVCVTGLITVDTATFWTPFGQWVILGLIQIGGFGIMTLATMLSLMVGRRLGLRNRLLAQAETHTVHPGDVGGVIKRVAAIMAICEVTVAVLITIRFRLSYYDDWATALKHGVFQAVSAFNNAGFSTYSDSLIGFVGDPWVILPICAAVVLGGIGFPVIMELLREFGRPARWTIHTRITVMGSGLLLAVGIVAFLGFEWANPQTLGPMGVGEKLLAGVTGGVMPRTAGFNSVDYATITPETSAFTTVLMFIGGGSAGTAGGVKVTTFFLLAYVIWAEIRGERDVTIAHRSISEETQRQALSVALLGVAAVVIGTLLILMMTSFRLDEVLFEATSAFAIVGLSMGITAELPASAQLVLMVLMFIGRVGTITVASAFALRSRPRFFRLPEERPIVG